ncbi:MAG: hypothetical protein COX62_08870 [Deltaproteobacteria bacterium CG_4_10_14_0_2_um_filter_43_8]|nr:MAG: hypothetical protein COV43_07810 [Deltaproteobacteria bacterium CG11_big_fil_rev_8_21_14_0_20_42_23]PJA18312.1 MAG: hypothetical protein COX62_08870 [Deltaproteobacteria bacterium CG_4_10_14_0_2_um_filter_43_8]PJC63457.1 MAG: hypothetical protein CO021_09430 [Deltaproteobacteria bacterium CG_4_9_14_0_2_um_filter_42_21]
MSNIREHQILSELVEKQDDSKQTILKRFSPSSHQFIFMGGAFILLLLIVLLTLPNSKQPPQTSSQQYEEQLMERIIPQEEITPDYLEQLSLAQEKESERDKSQFQRQKEREEKNKISEEEKKTSREVPPVQANSMMIFSEPGYAKGFLSLGLPLGTELPAILEKTVITQDGAVPVIAKITRPIEWDGKVVIPEGTRVFGVTSGMIEDRVHVNFTRLVFPDGVSQSFSGIALGEEGAGGIAGKVKKKHLQRGRGVVSSALLGATQVFTPSGGAFGELTLRGAHQGTLREMNRDQQYYQRTEAMPVITLHANTPITILINQQV